MTEELNTQTSRGVDVLYVSNSLRTKQVLTFRALLLYRLNIVVLWNIIVNNFCIAASSTVSLSYPLFFFLSLSFNWSFVQCCPILIKRAIEFETKELNPKLAELIRNNKIIFKYRNENFHFRSINDHQPFQIRVKFTIPLRAGIIPRFIRRMHCDVTLMEPWKRSCTGRPLIWGLC